ncbi:MAG TPA: hypothetical protein VK993_06000 [Chthoniobacterales bacterium]|nr:hypothetical protein [Chthoniobacterales bacterium]
MRLGHRRAFAAVETILWIVLETSKHGAADRALHEGRTGWEMRIDEFLTGPLALILRFTGLVPASAIAFLLGAFVSRFAWVHAGEAAAAIRTASSLRSGKLRRNRGAEPN